MSRVSDDFDCNGFDGDGEMLSPPPDAVPDPGELGGSSSSSAKGKKAVIITKDEEYFMESAFMVFQVERCLFRVPSYLFSNESHVFGGMFRLPQPYPHENGSDAEGSSEANPIILPDEFTKVDFRCLLKALYPLSFTLRLTLSKDEWISVLKLSTKWYFLNLRETAISELEGNPAIKNASELTSLDKITYGRKYYVSSWLVSGLVDLVMREASISDDEALDIDSNYPTTAYKLFRARELRWRGFLTSRPAAVKEIESLFENELTQVRSDEKAYEAPEVEIEFEVPEKISMTPFTIPTPTPKQETPRQELVDLNSDDEGDETEYWGEVQILSTPPDASPPPLIHFGQPSFGGRGFGGRGRGWSPLQVTPSTPNLTRGRGGKNRRK